MVNMKKILLVAINAKYIHSNLAVYSLKKYAEETGADIEIAEYTVNQYVPDIVRDIYLKKPDIVAFSCYIWNRDYVGRVIEDIAKVLPERSIWAGGPEASYNATAFLKQYPDLSGIMVGEGEAVFKNLTLHYIQGNPILQDIKGIIYRDRKSGEIISNPPESLLDLSTIPFPYDNLESFKNKIIYYESSRGCPFSCSYCLSSIDKKLRFRNIELVKRELKYFIDHNIPQVKFVDRTFNCKKSHAMEIWKFILEQDNGITNFHFEISADLLDEEELELLSRMRAGLVQFEIGVQSTNPVTIAEIDRTMNLDKLKYVVGRINGFRTIHQHLDLIAGLPYEDFESFKKSFNDVYAMKPEQLQLGFLKVLSGANMESRAEAYGLVYSNHPPYEVLYTKWLTYEEILKLKKIENVVEIYYNSRQFINTMAYLERKFQSPFDMYEQLAMYYSGMEQNGEKHSRIAKYDLLLQFIQKQYETVNGNYLNPLSIYCELLMYDVYLRENIKTRPAYFQTENSQALKSVYRQYKAQGKNVHIEKFYYDIRNYSEMIKQNDKEAVRRGPEPRENYVLFDYGIRNKVNHEAAVSEIVI